MKHIYQSNDPPIIGTTTKLNENHQDVIIHINKARPNKLRYENNMATITWIQRTKNIVLAIEEKLACHKDRVLENREFGKET